MAEWCSELRNERIGAANGVHHGYRDTRCPGRVGAGPAAAFPRQSRQLGPGIPGLVPGRDFGLPRGTSDGAPVRTYCLVPRLARAVAIAISAAGGAPPSSRVVVAGVRRHEALC